jgi:plasmid stability protein
MKRDRLKRRAPRKDRKMEVTIRIPDNLAAEARAHGVSVEVYVQEILARQALDSSGEQRLQSVRAAIDRILELRKGNKLAGLRTKDLIHSAGIKTIC